MTSPSDARVATQRTGIIHLSPQVLQWGVRETTYRMMQGNFIKPAKKLANYNNGREDDGQDTMFKGGSRPGINWVAIVSLCRVTS